MSTSLTSQTETGAGQPAERVMAKWGPLTLLTIAISYSSGSLFSNSVTAPQPGPIGPAFQPLVLFSIGLAPMFGAALVVWTSRHRLSPQDRRSRLVGAATSAVLFFPALVLVRFFG